MPITVQSKVGRLIEGTIGAELTLTDVQQFRTRMWALIGGVSGRVVLYGDISRAASFDPEVERRLVEMLRHDNPKVERSAIFVGRHASAFAQQVTNMIAQANAVATTSGRPVERRSFTEAREAERWLGEVLDDEERARLRELVG